MGSKYSSSHWPGVRWVAAAVVVTLATGVLIVPVDALVACVGTDEGACAIGVVGATFVTTGTALASILTVGGAVVTEAAGRLEPS